MTLAGLLTHTASIQGRSTATDRFGQPLLSYTPKDTVACRLSFPGGSFGGGERLNAMTRDTVRAPYVVFFAADSDIAEKDIILEIKDDAGNVLASDLEVQQVRKRTGAPGVVHHIEADCIDTRKSSG
jgi:hypothetical protein